MIWRVLEWPLAWVLLSPILLYRHLLSPFLPPTCRFQPSCSAYGVAAIRKHGPFKGLYLLLRRVMRCHPWHPGGYDPP